MGDVVGVELERVEVGRAAGALRSEADRLRSHMVAAMTAAYVLSFAHTVHGVVTGIAPDTFTLRTPVTWVFYGVGAGATVLATRRSPGAVAAATAWLVAQMAIGILVYPDDFGPRQQTTFGWFENDVFLGLVCVGLYLGAQRLRAARRP